MSVPIASPSTSGLTTPLAHSDTGRENTISDNTCAVSIASPTKTTAYPNLYPPETMWAVLPLLMLASVAQALYFFVDASEPKCFYEDLPKDTLVVGHYAAEEWDERSKAWQQHQGITIYISVEVSFSPSVAPQDGNVG